MDLKRLSHLVSLAEEAHFGRAAQRVHLSQPAFSRSIQAAECELGLKLFERAGGEVACTPSGAFVVERARKVLRENSRMERDLALFRDRQMGDIAFGVGPIPAATLLPLLVEDIRRQFPAVAMTVKVNAPHYLLDHVRREEHDFFLGDTREVPRDGTFHIRHVGRRPGGFYARAGHPLFGRPRVCMADLVPYGLATGRLPDSLCAQLVALMGLPAGATLPVALECDDTAVLKRIALDTDTVMAGTDDILAVELERGTMRALRPVDFPQGYSELGLVWLEGRTHSPIADYAISFLTRAAREATTAAA